MSLEKSSLPRTSLLIALNTDAHRCNTSENSVTPYHHHYLSDIIGRYLANAPPNDNDKDLSIKTAFGNGMRPEYWNQFKNRYNIGHIVEFYAATEGTVALFNNFDVVGAIGYVPRAVDFLYPVKMVRSCPDDFSQPFRNAAAFCESCGPNEIGLVVGPLKGGPVRFEGYTDGKATNDKILTDVFRRGDSYFNTGDLMYRDEWGYFFWSDRAGDTFRWKGENVATTEVGFVLSAIPGVVDVTVYGVTVSGYDGKAGMAIISIPGSIFDWLEFMKCCKDNLPSYARPVFVRVVPLSVTGQQQGLQTNGSYKHVKTDLIKEVIIEIVKLEYYVCIL